MKCVYCGLPATTIDHVLPRSVVRKMDKGKQFPKDTLPPDVTVPACKECNGSIGACMLPTIKERRAALVDILQKRYEQGILLESNTWVESKKAKDIHQQIQHLLLTTYQEEKGDLEFQQRYLDNKIKLIESERNLETFTNRNRELVQTTDKMKSHMTTLEDTLCTLKIHTQELEKDKEQYVCVVEELEREKDKQRHIIQELQTQLHLLQQPVIPQPLSWWQKIWNFVQLKLTLFYGNTSNVPAE